VPLTRALVPPRAKQPAAGPGGHGQPDAVRAAAARGAASARVRARRPTEGAPSVAPPDCIGGRRDARPQRCLGMDGGGSRGRAGPPQRLDWGPAAEGLAPQPAALLTVVHAG